MGEIIVARCKRRRSDTPGVKERKKTVRDIAIYWHKPPFGRIEFSFKIVVKQEISETHQSFAFFNH
jgi:hypothetical protein